MQKNRILIADFYPMREFENFNCTTLTIVAVARNLFLPELNPLNFEIGTFSIDFDYDHAKLADIEEIRHYELRRWKDFKRFVPILFLEKEAFDSLAKNLGITYIKHKQESAAALLRQVENHLENGSPVIVPCNAYHLHYAEYYRKVPGGVFNSYHNMVVYGISRKENKVWVYDPTLKNYQGFIGVEDFINAVEDDNGIDNFEGFIYYTLSYNGVEFDDMNRELLLGALDFYLNQKKGDIKEKLLIFFNDFIYLYNNLLIVDHKNKLLEFGFYVFRELAFRRTHWWDFLEYYQTLADYDWISEENAAFKVQIDKLFGISNKFYANSLKEKKKLSLDDSMNKLEEAMSREKIILHRLYEKIKKPGAKAGI
jgi:hypothetical protein